MPDEMQITPTIPDRSREMDEKKWWDFWNGSYRAGDDIDAIASELFTRAAAVINGITVTGGCRVLEVACGTGALSRLLNYSSYHGIDISPAAIDVAREKAGRIVRPAAAGLPAYEAADFHDWLLPRDPFDLAVCVDAVSCFRDQGFVLRKISQSLRNSGRLVLTTINPFVYNRIRRTRPGMLQNGPVSHWLSRDELHALIESAGLTIERSCTIMPRGNCGILRLINAGRVNEAFGPRSAAALRRLKELAGLGQYRLVVARKIP
jgi:2-polyprenyl-3-methyl-5-hydroxy-6-metoxy-1,4-benzoquinol methylase